MLSVLNEEFGFAIKVVVPKRCTAEQQEGALTQENRAGSFDHLKPENGGPTKACWFQVKTIEDVQQNSKHQQHSPGKEDCAAATIRSLHWKNKGFKGISRPHVLLWGARQEWPFADRNPNLRKPFQG